VVVAWGESEALDTVIVWDTRTGEYAGRVLGRSGKRASISPDGAVVAVVWPSSCA
jgi:hypothetical protein